MEHCILTVLELMEHCIQTVLELMEHCIPTVLELKEIRMNPGIVQENCILTVLELMEHCILTGLEQMEHCILTGLEQMEHCIPTVPELMEIRMNLGIVQMTQENCILTGLELMEHCILTGLELMETHMYPEIGHCYSPTMLELQKILQLEIHRRIIVEVLVTLFGVGMVGYIEMVTGQLGYHRTRQGLLSVHLSESCMRVSMVLSTMVLMVSMRVLRGLHSLV